MKYIDFFLTLGQFFYGSFNHKHTLSRQGRGRSAPLNMECLKYSKFSFTNTYNADARASSLISNIDITKVIWIVSKHM